MKNIFRKTVFHFFLFASSAQMVSAQTVRDFEGNVYNTVTIGTQTWMAENLRARKYPDGTDMDTTAISYCNNDRGTVTALGYLYRWDVLMKNTTTEGTQGACPDGWHVPSVSDYNTLITYLGGGAVAGKKLKSVNTAYWSSVAKNDNSSGFNAHGAGYRHNGMYFYFKEQAKLWTSTEDGTTKAREVLIQHDGEYVFNQYSSTRLAVHASCRCVKDVSTDVRDIHESASIHIYPNPSSGQVQVEWKGGAPANMEVVNMLGQTISRHLITSQLHVSLPGPGLYLIRISTPGQLHIRKAVVQ